MSKQFMVFACLLALNLDAGLEAAASCTPVEECPQFCPLYFDPVCASNGNCHRIFGNACELNRYNCSAHPCERKFRKTSSKCCAKTHRLCKDSAQDCAFACPFDWNPVCGSNGVCNQTFSNSCNLNAYNCYHPYDVYKQISKGECCPGVSGPQII